MGIFFAVIILVLCHIVYAGNPIIKDIGMSDPHVRVFNDTVYLYTGHDDDPNDPLWVMKEWRIFRSTDLVDWEQVGTISPKDNYMDDNSISCWAGDADERNGQYYFYFSDHKNGVGVMKADRPEGPFVDALGGPLVSPMHDPTILIDDDTDAAPYIVYGDKAGGGFHIARLNDNMISVAETPRPIIINGEEWKKAPHWMDKNYIFKHNGTYYLSWGRDYAISDNIYGPYESVGAVGIGHNLDQFAHGSFFWWKGQFYHIWCYYLRNGFKYRESIITYCHFDDNGNIVTDTGFLDKYFKTGVGQYDASWDRIEAEWYYEIPEDPFKQNSTDGGFELAGLKNGSWIRYANMDFGSGYISFTINLARLQGAGSLEIRTESADGPLLGTINVDKNMISQEHSSHSVRIDKVTGKKDLFIKVFGDESFEMSIDWFNFSNINIPSTSIYISD